MASVAELVVIISAIVIALLILGFIAYFYTNGKISKIEIEKNKEKIIENNYTTVSDQQPPNYRICWQCKGSGYIRDLDSRWGMNPYEEKKCDCCNGTGRFFEEIF